jgi:hypothetical protein
MYKYCGILDMLFLLSFLTLCRKLELKSSVYLQL